MPNPPVCQTQSGVGLTIEVYGGQMVNFGDELMLEQIAMQLGRRIPELRFAMYPRDLNWAARARHGLRPILPGLVRRPVALGHVWEWIDRLGVGRLNRLLPRYGLVPPHEVQGVLTMSGFAFSDVWSASTRNAAAVFERYARRSVPVVLLPQAIGPLNVAAVRKDFLRIASSAKLILVRDAESLGIVRGLLGDDPRVRRCWDITLVEPVKLSLPDGRVRVAIVPNARMVDRASSAWRSRYVRTMREIISHIGDRAEVKVLIHGAEPDDEALGIELTRDQPIEVLTFEDGPAARRALSEFHFVVGSRYHALVGAFAQAIPSIGIGWAHKYRGLYEDFDLRSFCAEEDTSTEYILELVDHLLVAENNLSVRSTIAVTLERIEADLHLMWDDVADVLRSS